MLPYRPDLKAISRKLRSNLTDAEQRLCSRLRRKQLHGVQFYRQRPVGRYIIDFLAPSAMLAIEVDGSQHMQGVGKARDEARDARLRSLGIQVMRFDDRQVLLETDAVVAVIESTVRERLTQRKSPPAPLFQRGED